MYSATKWRVSLTTLAKQTQQYVVCSLCFAQLNDSLNNKQLEVISTKSIMLSFVLSNHVTLATTAETVECCGGKVMMGFLSIVVERQNIF
jgi:hypothetical protein